MSGTPGRKPSRAPDRLRVWARAALRRSAAVTLRIVGAREARRLNRRFRNRDYATNVLTFAYPDRRPLAGDIAICAPVAAREARASGISREAHYAHLVIHGMLHLQGFDHENERDARRMERIETRILGQLGFADPYGPSRLTPHVSREYGRQST